MAMDRPDQYLCFSDHPAVRVSMAGRIAPRPGWSWRHPGGLDDALLVWFVVAGAGSIDAGGGRHAVEADDLLFPRLAEPLEASQDAAHPLEVLWATIECVDASGAARDLAAAESSLPPLRLRPDDPAFVRALLERLVDPFARGEGLNAEADGWLAALLREAARLGRRAAAPAGPHESSRPAVEALVREVLADPGRDWRVADMARRLHCCPDHFTRVFRSVAGQTPRRFLVAARIAAAKGMLRASSLPVGRIADELGYGDVYFFSKQFKAETGVAPTRYRAGGAS